MKGAVWWVGVMASVLAGVFFIPQLLRAATDSETPAAVVISRSMWPVLNRGDLILIKGASRDEIDVGTILVFRHEGGIALHRGVRIDGDTIVTKGDANPEEDDPIGFDDVVGRLPTLWGRNVKIPLVGHIALMAGSQVSTTLEGELEPAPPGFLDSFASLTTNPVGLIMLVVVPGFLLAALALAQVVPRLSPGYKRRRLRNKRLERVRKRWPRAGHVYR